MMNKKKIAVPLIVSSIVLLTAVGTINAYFVSQKSVTNTPSVGFDDVSIVETDFTEPQTQADGENIFNKSVVFENTGLTDSYIRARIEISNSEIESIIKLSYADDNYLSYQEFLSNHDGTDWIYSQKDGYFYYTKKVVTPQNPQEGYFNKTSELLKKVKVDYNDTEITVQPYDIIVYSESVQTIGNDGTEVGYAEAWKQLLGYAIVDKN